MAERGVPATTLRAVAGEAGVSTGSVTHYFEDKAELMAAVLEYNGQLASRRVQVAVGDRRGLAAAERATIALLPTDREQLTCWRVWLAFWFQPSADAMSGVFGMGYREWAGRVTQHLAEAVEDGELPDTLDLRHEVGLLGTLVAGNGLLAGSAMATRIQLKRRAKRIFTEHFAALAARGGVLEEL